MRLGVRKHELGTFESVSAPMTCTACVLHQSCITNCIPGRGPEHAEVMIVAQGPGGQEDTRGEVLVGPSGKLLDVMLRDAGYDPSEVYKTNATRCRAPRDRAPTPGEIDACRHHLADEIRRVRPRVIVALGDSALRSLCKLTGIREKRGKELLLHSTFELSANGDGVGAVSPPQVFATYHPAFVLRVPQAKNVVVADLRRVRDRTQAHETIAWQRYGTGTLVVPKQSAVAVDIEAQTFVDPKKPKKKTYSPGPVQTAVANERGCIVAGGDEQYQLLMPVAFMADTIVTHNGWDYDIPKIKEHLGVPLEWGRDTMVMAWLDDETQPLGLESLCVKYLGVRGWKEENDAVVGSDAFAEYSARDTVSTLRLYHDLLARLGPRIKIADTIILPGRLAMQDAAARGVYVSEHAVVQAQAETVARREAAASKLRRIVHAGGGYSDEKPFNPNSTAAVAAWLTAHGVYLPPTPTGKDAVGKGVLQALLSDEDAPPDSVEDFVRTLLDHRNAVKFESTYIEPYLEAARSSTHRIYHEFTQYKTVTGRSSERRSRTQVLPRKYKAFKSAPPGFVRVEADYATLEFRIAAWCAGEREILDRYDADPRWDAHRWFAARLYGLDEADIDKLKRQVAKSANFSQMYVGSPGTLIEYGKKQEVPIILSEAQAMRIHTAWHAAFPAFAPWYQSVWNEVKAFGYVETATGRRRHYGDVRMLKREGRIDVLREAVNMKVQPLATADLSFLALSECYKQGLPINDFIHDSIALELPEQQWYDERPAVEAMLHECMVERPLKILRDEFNVNITVPIVIDVSSTEKVQA